MLDVSEVTAEAPSKNSRCGSSRGDKSERCLHENVEVASDICKWYACSMKPSRTQMKPDDQSVFSNKNATSKM